jgi:hypothetical protein
LIAFPRSFNAHINTFLIIGAAFGVAIVTFRSGYAGIRQYQNAASQQKYQPEQNDKTLTQFLRHISSYSCEPILRISGINCESSRKLSNLRIEKGGAGKMIIYSILPNCQDFSARH